MCPGGESWDTSVDQLAAQAPERKDVSLQFALLTEGIYPETKLEIKVIFLLITLLITN